MRLHKSFLILEALMLLGVLSACQTPASSMTSVANNTPPAAVSAQTDPRGSSPIFQSMSMRTNVAAKSGSVVSVVPDFHFIAPNGNAIFLRRELVDTNGAISQTQIHSETINIPADAQKKGAVLSGGWRCGVSQYYLTLRAYLMDSDGNRSNTLEYTIHCNGG